MVRARVCGRAWGPGFAAFMIVVQYQHVGMMHWRAMLDEDENYVYAIAL